MCRRGRGEGGVKGARRWGAGWVNHMDAKLFQNVADIWMEKDWMETQVSKSVVKDGECPILCVCACTCIKW